MVQSYELEATSTNWRLPWIDFDSSAEYKILQLPSQEKYFGLREEEAYKKIIWGVA